MTRGYQPKQLLSLRDPKLLQATMPWLELLYQCYFRVTSSGWENIPLSGSFLIVASHNGGLPAPDMYMLLYDWLRRFGAERPAYGLKHRELLKSRERLIRAARFGIVPAEPKVAMAALRQGAPVLVYPGGVEEVFRPYSQRHRIHLAGRTGFIKLVLREEVPIVPVISTGAHETLIVLSDCQAIIRQLEQWRLLSWNWPFGKIFPIYLGLPWGLAIGPVPNIPLPVQIHLHVCPPIRFERYGREAARDRHYVKACYEQVHNQMQTALNRLIMKRRGLLDCSPQ